MISLFLTFALAKKPIVIIPSHFGSRLYMNSTYQPFWYCPKSETNKHVWIRLRDIPSPFLTCLLDSLTLDYDEKSGKLKSKPNTTFSTLDFGGVDGILGIGPEYFGRYLPVNYELYVKSFIENGYKVRKDLFSAPYDWRFGLEQPESYYKQLRALIENAYSQNGNTKVSLLAHGLGATLVHSFLTDMTEPKWRKTYIDSATYVAPAWSGSGQAFFATWRLRFPFIHIRFDTLRQFVASLGAFHATLPNSIAYANNTLIVGPDGRNYTGSELIKVLKEHGKLNATQFKAAEQNFKHTQELPKQPDFNVNIIFNSGVKTPMGLILKDWEDVGRPIYGHGDSLVGSKVIDWACENWGQAGIRLRCHDALSDEIQFHHRYLLKNPEIAKLINRWIDSDNYDDVSPKHTKKLLNFYNEL
ncbi:Lecithin:cholesterol acyltransferase family protein [Tritrichomonas foetus]|uniref:Lecithin:cholesterol acyltransferase family protein n=1 Tax=Tritrichomonas foetus TaxID=1144522 RepID=A0A1J4K102_9EUKA|nr:Lecithin:cholesterol acyltransferase family protein [Tritrichomonas foetus]|eukprot:OHT05105.1 Lecithin:cholesterol acyltransferase family protein [Tritrichomonas foetus]